MFNCRAAPPRRISPRFSEILVIRYGSKQRRYIKKRDSTMGLQHAVPCFAGGGGYPERPAGETPPPPRRDLPRAGCAWQECIVCAARLSAGVVRDLLGLPLGRRGSCVARTRPQIRQKLSATVSFCYGVAISSMNSQVVRVDFVLEGFRCAEDSVSIHNLVQFMSTRCMHLFLEFFVTL